LIVLSSNQPRGLVESALAIYDHDRSLDRGNDVSSLEAPSRITADDHDLPPGTGGEGTRRRILLAGLELFAERGYFASSIRDIAARATLKSATLYTHFESKEAILAELVLLGHDFHHRLLVTALLESGEDPRDQLVGLVRAHVCSHADYALLATVANNELDRLRPEAAAAAIVLRDRSGDLLTEVLERGIERRVFQVVDPLATRLAIATMGRGVANWYPSPRNQLGRDQVAEAYATLALRMVGATPR
jgi:AcrR family transcriptional regulator